MAKKKKTAKKKTNSKTAKKKSARKPAAKKKAEKRKRGGAGRSSGSDQSKSVDSIIKKYVKERSALETKLALYKKKKAELESRSARLQEEIQQLGKFAEETTTSISLLDVKRDAEIGSLLSKLGVQLGGPAATPVVPQLPNVVQQSEDPGDQPTGENEDAKEDSVESEIDDKQQAD